MAENDFIATEMLQEMKRNNKRSYTLNIILIVVIVFLCSGFIWYLNQYDFVSEETHYANGEFALVDSEGNVVVADIPEDKVGEIINGYSSTLPQTSEDTR